MKIQRLGHRFVAAAPEDLDAGVLYVSLEYDTVLHLCCCGCGSEIVTPLSPARWQMTYDGESMSLWPSIGNWGLPCRSHYIIRRGQAVECRGWSDAEVTAGQRRDQKLLEMDVPYRQVTHGLEQDQSRRRLRRCLDALRSVRKT